MKSSTNWVKELPSAPMPFLLGSLLLEAAVPGQENEKIPLSYSQFGEKLVKKIRETNGQILRAKTRDETVMAEARVKLFKEEQKKIDVLSRKVAVKCLLHGEYFATAYLDGEVVIVPSRAWSGKIDWDEARIVFARKEYSHFRVISHGRLTEEQRKLVEQYAAEDIEAQRDEAEGPGRPSPGMHLIEQKLRERAAAKEMEDFLNVEARVLADWFKRNHPDKRPITAKTIANKHRSLYRTLKGKTA